MTDLDLRSPWSDDEERERLESLTDPDATSPTDGSATLRGQLLHRAQLGDLPQPQPLIEDTLDMRTVALLSGRRSCGKSFIALDWACCVATGKPWQGREVTGAGPVLYVAAEGAHGLDQRVSAWEYAWHAKATALDVLPLPVNLFKGGALYEELVHLVRDESYALVIIDTWARSTVGGKENDNTDSTIAFERLDRLRRLGPTVLAVAHTDGTDSKTRGATALEDNADTLYRAKGDAGYLELYRDKRKDGPTEDRHQLQLHTIDLGAGPDGWPRTSCVVQNTRGHIAPLSARAEDLMSVFLDHFADMGCSKAELRKAASDMAPATFDRSLKALVHKGSLHNIGTDKRPFYKPGVTT